MKKKVMRLALLLVLPVAAAFVFSAYTGGGSDSRCPAGNPLNYTVMFPNPDDCSSFFMCSDGVAILMHCPDGLHFNAMLNVCDWPSSAGCETRGFKSVDLMYDCPDGTWKKGVGCKLESLYVCTPVNPC